ncbi:hypothetical protein LNP74_24030 [Klebsiella pneumoniae subsp. pneumoniae]|nr:hypothetical protein [Klebsiella pneumoniae subsp. pneumoniae]
MALSLWDLAPERAPRQPRPSLYPDAGPDIPRLQRARGIGVWPNIIPTAYLSMGCRCAAVQPGDVCCRARCSLSR